MNFHYLKSLSALALAGMFAINAYAESIEDEFVIDFTQMEPGYKLNSFWGSNPNDNMQVVATDEGNLLFINGVTMVASKDADGNEIKDADGNVVQVPAVNDAGLPSWSTKARYCGLMLPSGYNFSHIQLIEIEYKPTQDDNVPFAIQINQNATNPLFYAGGDVKVNEWNTLAFDPTEITTGEENKPFESNATSFDFCMGADGSSNYYIKSVKFFLLKDVTQREKDEAALDKATAACVTFDFDNWEVSGEGEDGYFSPYLGSNGGSCNRPDMIIDKGPDDYNNNCAHIIYGGHTNIFITQPVIVPDGYTFDDLRLLEYDLYLTDLPGVDHTSPDKEWPGSTQVPSLKIKDGYYWGSPEPIGDGDQRASTGVPTLGEWNKVKFYPSTFNWKARENVEVPMVDENGDPVMDPETNEQKKTIENWDAEKVATEFGKKTQFWISVGFRPCENQCYVDNVKLYFQKSGEDTAVESISAVKSNGAIYNIYGQKVDENYRGIVIKDGKKYIKK